MAPGDLDFIWDDIRATEGYSSFPDVIHNWVDLYQAVTNRDFQVIKRKASILLKTEQDPLQRKYLAVVGITSLMGENNYDEVLKVFDNIQSKGDIHLDFLEASARYHIKK